MKISYKGKYGLINLNRRMPQRRRFWKFKKKGEKRGIIPKDVLEQIGAVVCNPAERHGFLLIGNTRYAIPVDSPPFSDVIHNNPGLMKKPWYLLVTGETFPVVGNDGVVENTQTKPEIRKKQSNGSISKEELLKTFGAEEINSLKEMIVQKEIANKQSDKKLSKKIRKYLRGKGVFKNQADAIMIHFGG